MEYAEINQNSVQSVCYVIWGQWLAFAIDFFVNILNYAFDFTLIYKHAQIQTDTFAHLHTRPGR